MSKSRRWTSSLVKEAAKTKIDMPWARGPRRATWIAKRDAFAAAGAANA